MSHVRHHLLKHVPLARFPRGCLRGGEWCTWRCERVDGGVEEEGEGGGESAGEGGERG